MMAMAMAMAMELRQTRAAYPSETHMPEQPQPQLTDAHENAHDGLACLH